VLVTDLKHELLTIAQLYRDRGDAENAFDELKNQWGWGGFTTQDLARCRLSAMAVDLIYRPLGHDLQAQYLSRLFPIRGKKDGLSAYNFRSS
jgi:hypothetical protein